MYKQSLVLSCHESRIATTNFDRALRRIEASFNVSTRSRSVKPPRGTCFSTHRKVSTRRVQSYTRPYVCGGEGCEEKRRQRAARFGEERNRRTWRGVEENARIANAPRCLYTREPRRLPSPARQCAPSRRWARGSGCSLPRDEPILNFRVDRCGETGDDFEWAKNRPFSRRCRLQPFNTQLITAPFSSPPCQTRTV